MGRGFGSSGREDRLDVLGGSAEPVIAVATVPDARTADAAIAAWTDLPVENAGHFPWLVDLSEDL